MTIRADAALALILAVAGVTGCGTSSTLTVQNDAPYPIEFGTIMTSSGSGAYLAPPGGVVSIPIHFGSGASSSKIGRLYVMPQPPKDAGRGLRWVNLPPPGPFVVRVSDDGTATVYARLEDGREVGPGSGRIEVRESP